MAAARKIVLHSLSGYRPELCDLVAHWVGAGVKYVGVVGVDADRIEDNIHELCVGDGNRPYYMLTAAHGPDETLEDALMLARQVSEISEEALGDRLVQLDDSVEVVEF
jgi:hypothetical protein